MNVSIKKRIYGSFFLLVFLFVVNAIASIITLNSNRRLSENISKVTDPSLDSIENFEEMLVESKMYTTNWVFLRSSQEDKDALRKLHNIDYPRLKQGLKSLSAKWNDKESEDSLRKIYVGFEQLLVFEKTIMTSLQKFEDYDDPVIKLEAERIVEDELLPRTSTLMNALVKIEETGKSIKIQKNQDLEQSFMLLRLLTSVLAITIIFAGLFLSFYLARKIINPVNKIRQIVNDLGKGIIMQVKYKAGKNEIGEMIRSVNNLSEKLHSTAVFAAEIGNRNFDTYFEPLSAQDTLGKALVTMRNNIKSADQKLNEAQHIAHLGSLERDIITGRVDMSDEMFNIFDIDPASFDFSFPAIAKLVHPDDIEFFKKTGERYRLDRKPVSYECRIVTEKGITKNLFVQGKALLDVDGNAIKTFATIQDVTERKRGEEKLAEERALFQLVIENIPDRIYLKDTEGRFMLCNMPVAKNARRSSPADMTGKTDYDFLPEEKANECFNEEQRIIWSGVPLINHEEHIRDKVTGKSRWSLTSKFPLRNKTGSMIGLIGIHHDITNRKIAEKELEDVNKELNILFNSIDEIFFSVNMITLKVIQISPTCEKIYGYKPSEFLANYKLWFDIIHPDDKHIIEDEDLIMGRGEQINNQYRIIRKDKNIRWVETKITPTLDEQGKVIRVDGVTRDITERKHAEEELERSFSMLEATIESTADGILVADFNGKIVRFNKKFVELWGIPGEILDMQDDESAISFVVNQLTNPEEFLSKISDLYLQKEAISFDILSFKDGRTFERYSQPQLINGKSIGRVWSFRDITARTKSKEELMLKEKYNRNLFNQSTVGLALARMDGGLEDLNEAYAKIIGRTIEECKSLNYNEITPEKYNSDELEQLEELELTGRYGPYEKEYIHKDGHFVPVRLSGTILEKDGINYIWSSVEDISESKNAEIELHKSQERYRRIVETSQEGIWLVDENNKTNFVNKRLCEILGYPAEEIMGKELSYFMAEEDENSALRNLESIRQGNSAALDFKFITKSTSVVWTYIATSSVFNDEHKYIGALAMVTDITKRKHDEELLQRSQANLVINNFKLEQKNKELEQFAYVASHDLQEPLRTITSFVQVFKQQYYEKLDIKADKYLTYIVQASDRMRVLIKDLLDFSRIGHKKDIERVDCNLILHDVIADIDKAIKDSAAEIKAELLPVISGYSTELKQLFQNLLLNSIKFRKTNVPPRITIAAQKKNDHWQFAFTDNGIGIDKQHNERIFIIFQRLHTRSEYQGSGIGLSHCKKIVELHHGKIWVESTPGEGSTFYFTINSSKEKTNEPKIKLHNAY